MSNTNTQQEEVVSTFNIERLRKAVEWAEREARKDKPKRRWNQASWMLGKVGRKRNRKNLTLPEAYADDEIFVHEVNCGTTYCVAGNVCAGEKDKFVLMTFSDGYYDKGEPANGEYVIPKGTNTVIEVRQRARDLLGITDREADSLFDGCNSIQEVREVAARIAKKHGETL